MRSRALKDTNRSTPLPTITFSVKTVLSKNNIFDKNQISKHRNYVNIDEKLGGHIACPNSLLHFYIAIMVLD